MQNSLSRRQAAHLSVAAQGLGRRPRRRATADDVRRILERLACIQIDTISVVARSQYIVLWSRLGNYDPDLLDQLHFPKAELFEYWGHAASLIHTPLLPFFRSRMAERREMYDPAHYGWTAEHLDLIQHVLDRIENEGPLTSLAFERPDPDVPVEPWAWFGGKPTNRVFDYLWLTGEVGIRRRISFRREYELLERLHPELLNGDPLDLNTERRELADRALQAMGICRSAWLNDYFRTKWGTRFDSPPGPDELLEALVQAGRAIPVEIDGLGLAYVSADQAGLLDAVLHGFTPTRTTLLSPFDNLIWDRQRTKELFDFEYRIECYTPEPRRKYGYFCLPILRRGRLIGRLDPKIDRRTGEFILKAFHLEPGVRLSASLVEDVAGAVRSFARWNGAVSIRCQNTLTQVAAELTTSELA